jgi:subtilase family serine protease
MKRRLIPAASLLAAATAMATAGLLTLPAHGASASRHIVTGVTPTWATRAADHGALAGSQVIHGRIYLASRNQAGLMAFDAAVSTPGNQRYRHFLTPAQAAARFGSRPGAHGDVASWLLSQGLSVTRSNSYYVAFHGAASKVGAAFGVSIHQFVVKGRTVHAPVGQVSVPNSIASDVLTVLGLSTELAKPTPTLVSDSKPVAPTSKPKAKAFPCSAYEGQKMATKYPKAYGKVQPYAVCGYGPQQLNGAYGAQASGNTGKGVTVAVVDAYALPTMAKDLDQWNKNRNWQAMKKGQYTEYDTSGVGYNAGWAGEEALDVEAVHSMAPDANISFVSAGNSGNFLDAYQTIVTKKLGDAVNNSWEYNGADGGIDQGTISAYEKMFQMGASEGIGFYFSTGDGGGAGGASYPSTDPYATAVGGSAIGIDKKNKYMWETDWETDYSALAKNGKKWTPAPPGTFQSGTGGGTSQQFKQPAWQKGVVPKKYSEANGKTPMRVVPDIAAEADPTTGFLEGYSSQNGSKWVYAENRIGGTSLSCPLIIGMQADAEQAAGGKGFGEANAAIYKLYGSKAYHDVVQDPFGNGQYIAHVRMAAVGPGGSNVVAIATAGQAKDGDLESVKGYDTTTGVGTPTGDYYKMMATLTR